MNRTISSMLNCWIKHLCILTLCSFGPLCMIAQTIGNYFKAVGSPVNPKVNIIWYRYYDSKGLANLLEKIATAYPQYARLQSVGKSTDGHDILCITVTDFSKGDPNRKPAVYVQGNIHGNEIQGSEFSIYTAWYLTEMADDVPFLKQLLVDKVFYIIPTINPDARDKFLHTPGNAGSHRALIRPGGPFPTTVKDATYHDLDGDGSITLMRYKNPYGTERKGTEKPSFMYKRENMVKLPADSIDRADGKEKARFPCPDNYEVVAEGGSDGESPFFAVEGYDPDNYDLNRNWGWEREGEYPRKDSSIKRAFCYQETRNIRDFFLAHPNIVAAESFHNFCGEIYAGTNVYPNGTKNEKNIGPDAETVGRLAKYGERVLANYAYRKASYGGLPGREIDWMYGVRGVYSFIVELMTAKLYYRRQPDTSENRNLFIDPYPEDTDLFIDELLFGEGVVPWHKVNDPKLGEVEVGGLQRTIGRLHPGFLMQEDAHRNMAFTVRLAHEAPLLTIKNITVALKGKDIREITATIENTRLCGTHSEVDLLYKLYRPDHIILKTPGKIISAGKVGSAVAVNKRKNDKTRNIDPSLIMVDNIPGHSSLTVRWIVKGGEGNPIITVDSIKGGLITAPVKQ